jgi:cell wall assembly regulator SMI1
MFFVSIIFLTILIPSVQSLKPTLKLTFTPDEKYFTSGKTVDIVCEIINPTEKSAAAQLWYVDFKTTRNTPVSRSLINEPANDAPDIFKQNKNRRLEVVEKGHLRIKNLQLDDSSRYECNCPDCDDDVPLGKVAKDLLVMKLSEPKWHIEPGWPMQEHAKTTMRCTADDFYPYVSHKIIRHHHEINSDGKSVVPSIFTYPQKFSWEAVVTPSADWHNTTLRCTVVQGNSEQHATKNLEVLFTPRFIKCDERQHVDSTKEKSTIECTYAGNPAPKLTWVRQSDEKPIISDPGITIDLKDEHHGKYKSVVTFERDRLITIPLTTTTKSPNDQTNTTPSPKIPGNDYYQQLLNGGFIAKLTYNNEDRGSQKITIVGDANQARSKVLDNSTRKSIENLSTSMIFFSFFLILYMIQHH